VTRYKRQQVIRSAYRSLATEVDSHLANGSGFIFDEPSGEASADEMVALRVKVVRQVAAYLFKKADKP
jgi:hypothetical protein